MWKLKCSKCGHEFEIELSGEQRIVDCARDSECPSCHHAPASETDPLKGREFHRIVGFRAVPKPR